MQLFDHVINDCHFLKYIILTNIKQSKLFFKYTDCNRKYSM